MTALVIFVLGVLLLLGLAAGLGGRRYPTGEGTVHRRDDEPAVRHCGSRLSSEAPSLND
jgi:hypothetical protein